MGVDQISVHLGFIACDIPTREESAHADQYGWRKLRYPGLFLLGLPAWALRIMKVWPWKCPTSTVHTTRAYPDGKGRQNDRYVPMPG